MKAVSTLLALAAAAFSSACFWDRDTLVSEAKGLPEVLQAIVGRFDRNPPLYYLMRLDRVTMELAKDPSKLSLYDDAGVAASRLGHQDDAIQWMEKKRKLLDRSNATQDDRYKTESNEGTFELIAWLNDPKRDAHKGQLRSAISKIERALQINPHAHFDREKYQLAYMKWVMDRKESLYEASPITKHVEDEASDKKNRADQTRALVGLIVLGPAWENADILGLLGLTISFPGHLAASLGYTAVLRRKELITAGSAPLDVLYDEDSSLVEEDRPYVEAQFRMLRGEADLYERKRADFMLAKMQNGQHPDTDAHFWSGWQETPPPAIKPMGWWQRNVVQTNAGPYTLLYAAFFGLVAIVVLIVALAVRFLMRRGRPSANV